MYTLEDIQAVDPEIAAAITAEFDRQNSHIELIASENWVSPAVQKRTRYQAYPDPVSYVYIRTSDTCQDFQWILPSRHSHRSTMPECGVPTTADG